MGHNHSCKSSTAHIDKRTFIRIFKEHWPGYKRVCKYRPIEDEVVQKMLGCGDPENGYTQTICPKCGRRKKTPFSCKTRFCLSCARNHLEEWVTKIKSIMLKGIRHRHIILTMPDRLWSYFKKDRSLLKVLSDAADLLIRDILKFYKKKDALIPGIISVAQTSSRRCTFNPHLHLLMTEGGLLFPSQDTSASWYPLTFIKPEALSHKWQYFLLTSLKSHLPDTPETRKLIDELFKLKTGFITYSKAQKMRRRDIVEYLIKYVVSPPIALRRIIKYDGRYVTYAYTPRQSQTQRIETVHVFRFISLLIQHIPEKGQKMVRYYGLYARNLLQKARIILKELAERFRNIPNIIIPKVSRVIYRSLSYRERMKKYFSKDPALCPACQVEMITEEVYVKGRGFVYDLYQE